ncbi:hypothetical protein F5X96DRAFT_668613 [Biscogniauxia mediterranea]|nr:hypothetical protein F5X96DRAFT_668613 [Biscogniauxia mediterranea]
MKFTVVVSLLITLFASDNVLAMPAAAAPDAEIQPRGGSCLSHCWYNGNTLLTFMPCFIHCWKFTHQKKPDDQGASSDEEEGAAKMCSTPCFEEVEALERQGKIKDDDEREAAFNGCMAPCEKARIDSLTS